MRRGALLLAASTLAGCGAPCEDGMICAVIGSGELGFNGDGPPGTETRLASPTSVGVDPEGRVFFVDYSNMRVRVLTDGGIVQTFVGNGTHAYSEEGAAALETPLENPVDAVWGPDGMFYVLPQHEGRVIRVTEDGRIERCAGTGQLEDSGDGGPALDAEMGYGGGLAFAPDGSLFISDNTFSRVRRVDPDGQIDTVLGTGSAGQGAEGYGPDVAIRNPERLVVDTARDRLLVADTMNHRVLSLDLESLMVTVLAGTGERGSGGDGGPATEALRDTPVGLQVDGTAAVLIADFGNDALRLVGPDGSIDTVAGGVSGDPEEVEPPEAFPIRGPAGLAWTPNGDLLVAERSGQRVLRWRGASDAL